MTTGNMSHRSLYRQNAHGISDILIIKGMTLKLPFMSGSSSGVSKSSTASPSSFPLLICAMQSRRTCEDKLL